MSNQKTKKEYNINRRATYFSRAKPKKQLRLWIPNSVEEKFLENPDEPSIMSLVYYIEANGVQRIDTSLYDADNPNFGMFYQQHLEPYTNNGVYFCSSDKEGGVSEGYIIDAANAKQGNDTATLLSLDIDNDGNIYDVYALITFRLVTTKQQLDTLMIETLCGNQALPGSGEGTRLMNYIQNKGKEIGIIKFVLHPVDTAIGYYKKDKFRTLDPIEAMEVNSSKSDSDSDSDSSVDDKITMQKNVRAISQWNKVKNSTKLMGIYKNNKNKQTKRQVEEKMLQKRLSKPKNMTSKKGIPIAKPFTTKTVKYRPIVTPYKEKGLAIPITPGKTLEKSRLRREIIEAEEKTRREKITK